MLKWGMEYKGYLVSVDSYMNLQVHFPQAPGKKKMAPSTPLRKKNLRSHHPVCARRRVHAAC